MTNMNSSIRYTPEFIEELDRSYPGIGSVDSVVRPISFCSIMRRITGAELVVDGGAAYR